MIKSRVGRRFGKLTVIEKTDPTGKGAYLCLCDCGGQKTVKWENLRQGYTKSCGCLRGEIASNPNRQHSRIGAVQHPLYSTWRGLLRRCYDKNFQNYPRYGGRGVTVCEAWRNDFFAFADYIGPKPTPNHTIDRINGAKGYEPGNVRWASPYEQVCNTTVSLPVLLRGERVTSAEACRRLGVNEAGAKKARGEGYPPHEAIALAAVRKRMAKSQAEGKPVDWSKAPGRIAYACGVLGLSAA